MIKLELDEVRRLTGPNLLWDKPGAIIDVFFEGIEPSSVVSQWQHWIEKLLTEFGWQQTHTFRLYRGGASFALSAPMDSLYTACDIAELAWDCSAAELENTTIPDWRSRLSAMKDELSEERNPTLLTIMQEASKHGVTCMSDDDEVSLGMGSSVDVWPARALPNIRDINWQKYRDVPRAFITGTNGKSTSVRLAFQIAKAAGINAGVTSTDFIKVGDEIIDTGDYSGPGGARMLLRDKRTEMAFLEVARGGILRRGIPVESVDAGLITNVASDHLGQYGINTVEELAETKFVVAKGLDSANTLVVNADNPLVVEQAKHLSKTLCWFSTDEQNPLVQQQLSSDRPAVFVREGALVYHNKGKTQAIISLVEVPMTMNGAAVHNVQNALGVIGLSMALDIPIDAIREGLKTFGSDTSDNPGRGNIYKINGATVMVDFAHNEHSMRAIVDTANQIGGERKVAMFSHAGDRSDQEIRDLTNAVAGLNADLYIACELEHYLRGRELGEITGIASSQLQKLGIAQEKIKIVDNPMIGTQLATQDLNSGDLVLLFVLADREPVHNYLTSMAN